MDDSAEPGNIENESPIIKHLVIAGGGAYGFAAYGALRETCKQGLWDVKNIESIQ